MALKENSRKVFDYVKANSDKDITYTLYRKTGPDSRRAVSGNLKMSKDDRIAIAQ